MSISMFRPPPAGQRSGLPSPEEVMDASRRVKRVARLIPDPPPALPCAFAIVPPWTQGARAEEPLVPALGGYGSTPRHTQRWQGKSRQEVVCGLARPKQHKGVQSWPVCIAGVPKQPHEFALAACRTAEA